MKYYSIRVEKCADIHMLINCLPKIEVYMFLQTHAIRLAQNLYTFRLNIEAFILHPFVIIFLDHMHLYFERLQPYSLCIFFLI